MPEAITLPDNPDLCPTCNTRFQGGFCHNCGEKKPSNKDYTLTKYATQAVDMFTHFDGKFFKSIKYLFFFPGKLTEENLAGRKVKLMKPVQLFILISVAYFLFMKGVDLFVSYFRHLSDRDPVFIRAVKLAAQKGISLEEYAAHFDALVWPTSKALIFVLVPLIGLGVWALYFRRIKQFVPHLIFATHFFTFFLAFTLLYFELVLRWFDPALLTQSQKLSGIVAGMLVLTVYLFMSLKRVYGQNFVMTLIKSFVLVCWLAAMIGIYKMMIGWATLLIA